MNRVKGFTLIELLTVIAIIALLAAIIFPVYSRVKDSAYRSSDMSNMNALRTGLELYRTDQGAYPPQLLGYVNPYETGTVGANVVPANQLVAGLYPARVNSINTFKPALLTGNDASMVATTQAVWPSVGSAYYAKSTNNQANQAFAPADGLVSLDNSGNLTAGGPNPLNYYSVDGYETALVKTPAGTQRELRYTLFWSGYGLNGGSAQDAPNQLGYTNPPDTTVITWDSYFREYDNSGNVKGGEKRDIVLFIGGDARMWDATDVANRAWQVTP